MRSITGLVMAGVIVWITQSTPAYAPDAMTFNPPAQHPVGVEMRGVPDFIPHEFNPDARLDTGQVKGVNQ